MLLLLQKDNTENMLHLVTTCTDATRRYNLVSLLQKVKGTVRNRLETVGQNRESRGRVILKFNPYNGLSSKSTGSLMQPIVSFITPIKLNLKCKIGGVPF